MKGSRHENRDEKGDIQSGFVKINRNLLRKANYTYIFHYYDESKKYYFPYFGLFSILDERVDEAKKNPDFLEVELYPTPLRPPYDFFISYHNWQLHLLVTYFKEVFNERAFIEGYQPTHKYERVILSKRLHHEIINFINEFQLLNIRDLIFEIISIAQEIYVDEIAPWETPEMQRLIKSAQREADKAIEVIQKLDSKDWSNGKPDTKSPSELKSINFIFNDGSIKIGHNWLSREFVEFFKRHYDDLHYKDWKTELSRYHETFEENIRNQQFKYRLAKSLYNLFTQSGFFKTDDSEQTPNRLMLCISKLLEFCLIRVGTDEEVDEIKIRHIRNWIIRNDFEPTLTHLNFPADKNKLHKYFETELIDLVEDVKKADALTIALFIGRRFGIEHLIADLAHIAQALKQIGWLIGHQLTGDGGGPYPSQFPEFISFKNLINGIEKKNKLVSFKFKMEGDEKEYEMTQRLPLFLIEKSIKQYVSEQQVEFDTETVRTHVKRTDEGSFKIEKEKQFCQPEYRFMVRFVKSFYGYLLAEAPPIDASDYKPSERYYTIIAIMLQSCWFFYHQRNSERFITDKVKEWHRLSEIS